MHLCIRARFWAVFALVDVLGGACTRTRGPQPEVHGLWAGWAAGCSVGRGRFVDASELQKELL